MRGINVARAQAHDSQWEDSFLRSHYTYREKPRDNGRVEYRHLIATSQRENMMTGPSVTTNMPRDDTAANQDFRLYCILRQCKLLGFLESDAGPDQPAGVWTLSSDKTATKSHKMILLHFVLLAVFSISEAYRNWFTMEGEAFVVKCPDTEVNDTVTWHLSKTNTTISTDETMRIYYSGMYLWFLPTSINDSGQYICVKQRSDSQTNETLSVKIHPYKNGICYYGEDLYSYTSGIPGSGKIYCPSIDKYKNASDVKWYKDCKHLHGSRYAIQNPILYISGASENDTGNYTCQFTYSHGGRKFNVSATRTFEVVEDPSPMTIKIIYPQDNDVIKAEIGFPQNLSCKALIGLQKQHLGSCFWDVSGDYELYRQPYMVPNKGYFEECVLSINKVREEDLNKTFTCVVSNDVEERTVSVTLQRKEPSKGHKNTYLIAGFVTLFVVTTILMALYKFFLVDIVLLYRKLFKCSRSQDVSGSLVASSSTGRCPLAPVNPEVPGLPSFGNNDLQRHLSSLWICQSWIQLAKKDFLPISYFLYVSADAMNAMEKRIQKSRRLIILLTQCLAANAHFAYEHHVAFYDALIQNNTKVILLEMERIRDYAQLQESLRHLINQQGTIKWKEKYMCQPFSPDSAFWKYVRYQMPVRHNPGVIHPTEFVLL
uniref:Uncharacterized protein n=1 Tax=Sphaerodactylus townsendi TaxID=933632 RepID=A0ACB8FIZ0_9SAUR